MMAFMGQVSWAKMMSFGGKRTSNMMSFGGKRTSLASHPTKNVNKAKELTHLSTNIVVRVHYNKTITKLFFKKVIKMGKWKIL
jgi:hypothetical protein